METLEPRLALNAGPLVIGEFMAINNSTLADNDGDFSDWIEIHNPTDQAVDLAGWHLSDDASDLTQWTFPAMTIEPGEQILVFASNKDRRDPAAALHTNFRLSGDGEYLALVQPNGTTIAHEFGPTYPSQIADVSFGEVEIVATPTVLLDEGANLSFRVPTVDDAVLGTDWTTPQFNDSDWEGAVQAPPVVFTEVSTLTPDWAEIQNMSEEAVDTSGWVAYANNGSAGLNEYHATPWHLPDLMEPGEVVYCSDDDNDTDHYWNENINWRSTGSGWLVLMDDMRRVADFVAWGYGHDGNTPLSELDVTIEGVRITPERIWSGPAADEGGRNKSLQRIGDDDHDSAADFIWTEPPSKGEANVGLTGPFPGAPATPIGFGVGSPDVGLPLQTDVSAKMRDVNASLWTRTQFFVDPAETFDVLQLRMKYDDGFVAYLNGTETARRNAPEALSWDSTATTARPSGQVWAAEDIDLTGHVDVLVPGANTLAIHALNATAGDGDMLLSPVLIASATEKATWHLLDPTPGTQNTSGVAIINEIHYDPADGSQPGEFIELHNPSIYSADLGGWTIEGGVDYTFAEGAQIPGGGYLLVAQDPDTLAAQYDVSAVGPWESTIDEFDMVKLGRLDNDGEPIRLRDRAGNLIDRVAYKNTFPWPIASRGDGCSMELINPFLDNDLGGSWRASGYDTLVLAGDSVAEEHAVPSPGARNSVWSKEAAPQIRQVAHSTRVVPTDPNSLDESVPTGQSVVVTAKATDPDGIDTDDVLLKYQVVLPGDYIPGFLPRPMSIVRTRPDTPREHNPAYENPANWTTVIMVDDGTGADEVAGDDIYTAVIPGQAVNRTLVRYRVTATDQRGNSVTAPLLDDESLNFAYYVYDGVPDYVAADGSGTTYSSEMLTELPVYSLVARAEDITQMMAYNGADQVGQSSTQAARRCYNWQAAFVYDGKVHDHIDIRLRGANGRYHERGKRSMKFRFNTGYYLQARDQDGVPYETKWRQLVTSKMFGNRIDENWGISEQVNYEMFRLVDVPAPYAHWFHFRVVDDVEEAPTDYNGQYWGDFWGLSVAYEPYDTRFLEAHDLPDGNLYKLTNQVTNGELQQRYQALGAAPNSEDYNNIVRNISKDNPTVNEAWLREYVNYDEWYRYHTVAEAIKHLDYWPSVTKNMTWYFHPDEPGDANTFGQLWYLPYDTDASWGPTWNAGHDAAWAGIYGSGGKPNMQIEYRNVIREFRDLIFQPEVINPWIERVAEPIMEFYKADIDRWKTPSDARNAGYHNWKTAEWKIDDMKKFAFSGGSWAGGSVPTGGQAIVLDNLGNAGNDGTSIPETATVTYVGAANYPTNDLHFSTTAFADPQGTHTFKAMEWRIAEITDPNAPEYDPSEPVKFEWNAAWESGELTTFDPDVSIPEAFVRAGRTYRVRVRMQDTTDRWGHWSEPVEFTATGLDNTAALAEYLRVSELNYNPYPPTEAEMASGFVDNDLFEFIEIINTSNTSPAPATLLLDDLHFVDGVSFDFAASTVAALAPGQRLVLARDADAFAMRYGDSIEIAGIFSGALSNGGEHIAMAAGLDDTPVLGFTYNDTGSWPGRADGGGSSLEAILPDEAAVGPDDSDYWRSSADIGGSPGGEGTPSRADVVVNEVLTHTDPPMLDSIELYNKANEAVDIGGWYLSDAAGWRVDGSDAALRKFQIPHGTIIEGGGYLVFDEADFHPNGAWNLQAGAPDANEFSLDGAHGDDVWLVEADAEGALVRFADHVDFDAAANGESFGRWPNGLGALTPMQSLTLGAENDGPRVGPLVISEIMFQPPILAHWVDTIAPRDLEFVEIFNPTLATVPLEGWRINGADYNFTPGQMIEPGGVLVVLSFDPSDPDNATLWAAFAEHQGLDPADTSGFVGGHNGQLDNNGERLELWRPDEAPALEPGFTPMLLEDEVRYEVAVPWPVWEGVDRPNHSLQRGEADGWGNDPTNWEAATATPGTVPWSVATSAVVGRHVFYNNSWYDGNDAAIGATDDEAIATDKNALLPGQTASSTNYTNFSRGINGVMIDVAGLADAAAVSVADFALAVGNDNDTSTWETAPAPHDVIVRQGVGDGGADRITLTWDDGTIVGQWLEVRLLATPATGLDQDDVFYFGNAPGEAGDSTENAMVTTADEILARNSKHGLGDLAFIDDAHDFNRDRLVNVADRLIARNGRTDMASALKLITPASPGGLDLAGEVAPAPSDLTWLGELGMPSNSEDGDKKATAKAVDALLAAYGMEE